MANVALLLPFSGLNEAIWRFFATRHATTAILDIRVKWSRELRWCATVGPEIHAAFGFPDSSICCEVSGFFSALVLSVGMLAKTFPVSLILAIHSASHFANSLVLARALIVP